VDGHELPNITIREFALEKIGCFFIESKKEYFKGNGRKHYSLRGAGKLFMQWFGCGAGGETRWRLKHLTFWNYVLPPCRNATPIKRLWKPDSEQNESALNI
jgi:hypothetical protein